jgi:hypothetical protein
LRAIEHGRNPSDAITQDNSAGAAALDLLAAAHAEDRRGAGPQHVLLISVDGMHEVDLRLWVANHPTGALAEPSRRGTTFSKAYTTAPSDSFPGMIAQVTGGTPTSTGVFYDDSYERTYFPPGSGCAGAPGSEAWFAENLDKSLADYTGGGTLGQPLTQIDPAKLPMRRAASWPNTAALPMMTGTWLCWSARRAWPAAA